MRACWSAVRKSRSGTATYMVEPVAGFIDSYLDDVWQYKHNARPRQRKLAPLEAAARTAVLGLSDHHDLGRLWEVYERQIADRLATASNSAWLDVNKEHADRLRSLARAITQIVAGTSAGNNPLRSELTLGSIYPRVSRSYTAAREAMSPRIRNRFDELFQQWLYFVYDPLTALAGYFGGRASEAAHRMRRGTGARVNEVEILGNAKSRMERAGLRPRGSSLARVVASFCHAR